MKKTIVVELYAGPGAGKSTSAALLFSQLKMAGINTEIVQEFVKDWAWENKAIQPHDQPIIYAGQLQREARLYGKTDVIVTDSPLHMNTAYCSEYEKETIRRLNHHLEMIYPEIERIQVFVKRSGAFDPLGRYHNEEQAKELDNAIVGLLDPGYLTIKSGEVEPLVGYITRIVRARQT